MLSPKTSQGQETYEKNCSFMHLFFLLLDRVSYSQGWLQTLLRGQVESWNF